MSKYRWIYTTWPDAGLAETAAAALVGEGLCACANILPGVRSVYRWQGRIETDDETVMILKAETFVLPQLRARVLAIHPAVTPCFLALKIDAARSAGDFLAWISAQQRREP